MKVIYPGSFDPPTLGHVAIVARASSMFSEVVVVVANNPDKSYWLKEEERLEWMKASLAKFPNVRVVSHGGLVIDIVKELGAQAIVKGLRSEGDYRGEQTMAEANAILGHGLETLFLMSRGDHQILSSSLVRQVHELGGDVRPFVPKIVSDELMNRE
jgi:pantetheine-phosphate adenylyltransferase